MGTDREREELSNEERGKKASVRVFLKYGTTRVANREGVNDRPLPFLCLNLGGQRKAVKNGNPKK